MSNPEFFDTPGYGAIARTRNYYSQALRMAIASRSLAKAAGTRISASRLIPGGGDRQGVGQRRKDSR